MKTIFMFMALFAGLCTASAQVDTIYTHEGVIPCNVVEVTETAAMFQYPGESHNNSLSLNAISKIVFRSGRVQEFAARTSFRRLSSPMEWQQVAIAGVESEVKGLYKLDDVSSKAKGTTKISNQERVKRRAIDKMKMQSAILGGNVIYMVQMRSDGTKFNWLSGVSSTAETSLFGVAYSSQMPRLSDVEKLIKSGRRFDVVETVTMVNTDSRYAQGTMSSELTIDRIYDDSGLIMLEGSIKGVKERVLRVTFCNESDFYIAYKTRRGVFSYKVTVH